MNVYMACEQAYKNGFDAGQNMTQHNAEIAARVKVAYEQLEKCHTNLCRNYKRGENDDLIYDLQDVMIALLNIQVKLGVLKQEEDL